MSHLSPSRSEPQRAQQNRRDNHQSGNRGAPNPALHRKPTQQSQKCRQKITTHRHFPRRPSGRQQIIIKMRTISVKRRSAPHHPPRVTTTKASSNGNPAIKNENSSERAAPPSLWALTESKPRNATLNPSTVLPESLINIFARGKLKHKNSAPAPSKLHANARP